MLTVIFRPLFLSLSIAFVSLMAIFIAYFYMERYLSLEPCPLCILDRIVLGVLIITHISLAVSWRLRWTLGVWSSWIIGNVSLLFGFIFAGRHIWLQNREESLGFCLSENESIEGWLHLIEKSFDANASCADITWEWMGLSIPEQFFVFLVLLTLAQLFLGWRLK